MSDKIILVNPVTGKSKSIKVGVSWPVFFLGNLGIPFFFKAMPKFGFAFVWASVFCTVTTAEVAGSAVGLVNLIGSVVLSFWANGLEAKERLARGWVIAEGQNPAVVKFALAKWQLSAADIEQRAQEIQKQDLARKETAQYGALGRFFDKRRAEPK